MDFEFSFCISNLIISFICFAFKSDESFHICMMSSFVGTIIVSSFSKKKSSMQNNNCKYFKIYFS